MAMRREMQHRHRVPLGEININSPSADSKNNTSQSAYFDQVAKELRPHSQAATPHSQPSSRACEHSNAPSIDIFIDPESLSDHTTNIQAIEPSLTESQHANEHLTTASVVPPTQTLTFSNLIPPTEQARPAKPIIKSNPSHLSSPAHAQSPQIHINTPVRQRSAEHVGGIKSQQQGQGEEQYSISTEQTIIINHSPPSLPSSPLQSPTMLANTPGKRSVSNKENIEPKLRPTASPMTPLRNSTVYDALEAAVVESATPPLTQGTPRSPMQQSTPNDDLPAIERLKLGDTPEQAPMATSASSLPVEEEVPIEVQPSLIVEETPQPVEIQASIIAEEAVQQVEVQSSFIAEETSSNIDEVPLADTQQSPPPRSKKTVGPRPTKASMARISLAHAPQDTPRAPAWGRPRQSSGLGSTNNARLSMTSAQRVTSNGSTASEQSIKKDVVIPHSKPRPMSMSFPAPAPLPKSAKTPTRPTFQLPGEIVAQKLKEARELREKKDEGANKRVFKARPVPASIKAAPAVRPTNTSRARESLGLGKDASSTASARSTPLHSRANSVAVVRPSDRKSSISSRATSSGSDKPSTLGINGRLYKPHRASSSMANISKPRDASPPDNEVVKNAPAPKAAPISGKEVYNRHIFASEAAERDKREKEEATKKARAEAAERSRLLSREWAAKRRQQQAGVQS